MPPHHDPSRRENTRSLPIARPRNVQPTAIRPPPRHGVLKPLPDYAPSTLAELEAVSRLPFLSLQQLSSAARNIQPDISAWFRWWELSKPGHPCACTLEEASLLPLLLLCQLSLTSRNIQPGTSACFYWSGRAMEIAHTHPIVRPGRGHPDVCLRPILA